MAVEVPVIVVNWNGIADTLECMQSLLQSNLVQLRVYLVDNGSENDEGRSLIEAFDGNERVKVICLQENVGFAQANCLIVDQFLPDGIEYVILLNNDVVVEPGWLANLIDTAELEDADIVSSKLIVYDNHGLMDNAGHQMLNTGEVLPIGHRQPADRFTSLFENMGACAAACLYRISMIDRIGFFDQYFSTGYEDAELGLRAFVSGHKCVYASDAIAFHKGGQSIQKIFDASYARMIQKGIWYTYFKLMPWPVIITGLPFIMLKFLVLIALNLVFLRFKHLEILFGASFDVIGDLGTILKARRMFFHKIKSRPAWEIIRNQTFFLPYDFRRFTRIYLRKEPSALDQYGSV